MKAPLSPTVELTADPKTGEIRQAGSDGAGQYVIDFRDLAERDLYTFAKYVCGAELLAGELHATVQYTWWAQR